MIKALVYWNDHADGGFEVRLDQNSELGGEYGEAYAAFANDPYFNSTDDLDSRPDRASVHGLPAAAGTVPAGRARRHPTSWASTDCEVLDGRRPGR